MTRSLPTRKLPERPHLDQLKRQAKELLDAFLSGDAAAAEEVGRFFRDADPARFALHDAQLVLARSYGYDSWPKLKAFVDGATVARLIEATRAGDLDAVRALLEARPELANMPAAENDERRALYYAVVGRMPEVVRVLLRHGANPYAGISPLNEATSAVVLARERDYEEILAVLRQELDKPSAAGRPKPSEAPPELFVALQRQDEDRALAILAERPELARFHTPGGHGRSLLHAASALLMPRLAKWLLDHGSDVNARAADGATPLDCLGAGYGAEAMAELLRSRGAKGAARAAVMLGDQVSLEQHRGEIEQTLPDDHGGLLRLAVDSDRHVILKLLLSWGLDPDARSRVEDLEEVVFTWGMPLYQCARNGKHAMAEILLEHGADPNAQVYASGTPLSEAFGQRDERMIDLLLRFGGKPNPSMAGLYRRKDLAPRLLAEHGDTPLPDDGFGSGPVAEQLAAAAARGGDPEILRMALEKIDWPAGDPRWYGALTGPLEFWNHWIGPWCHPEWDRSVYLDCFRMILERLGTPAKAGRFGMTILHRIVTMGDHVTAEERAAFAEAALDRGRRCLLATSCCKARRWDGPAAGAGPS